MIQLFRPSMDEEELAAVAEVLRSGWIGTGPRTEAFEKEFAAYVGAPRVVGLSSCTAALEMAIRLLGIGPGDEVIVPAMTFVSTAHAVMYSSAKPIFADVDESSLTSTSRTWRAS